MLKRVGTALGLLALCALSILRIARPPALVPATSPDTVFSAERAMRHVAQIAQRPHAMGMADHDRVRDYIVGQLTALGLRSQIQQATAIGTRYREVGRVQNVLAWLPGTDPKGKALLLMVHYDGVEAGPAAADDGAACAALLETLRALRAQKQPLAHDVIALFTDGEESGLLGAAAFVREHPWAKDVAIVLNFEARGTSGRSLMFETGPGNLDAVRTLRRAGDVTAGSVFTTIYRALPNDTDLSELAVRGLPALNFAFADGVERYHTSHDDVASLNPGSVQHHGAQMLALARILASEALPRSRTGDAVFFDLPVIGLVVYPEWLAVPLAIVALALVGALVIREPQGVTTGALAAAVAVVLSGVVGQCVGSMFAGPARWSGLYATALALFALAVTTGCYALTKRWSTTHGLRLGALVIWLLLSIVISLKAPGASYLFVWPLLFASAAMLGSRRRGLAEWCTAAVTLLLFAGFIYGASVVMLGVTGTGAIALAVLTSLIALLLVPQLETIAGGARWAGSPLLVGAGIAVVCLGALTVKTSAAHPVRTALVYAENADSNDAWLGTAGGATNAWTREAVGTPAPSPAWATHLSEEGNRFVGRSVARVPLEAPSAVLVRDTLLNGARRLVLRIKAPAGTTGLLMRAPGVQVLTASIDGRIVDTTRYRRRSPDWVMEYWAVPDSGAIVALSMPAGSKIGLELVARRPGIPVVPGVTIPPRPPDVVPSQTGDVSIVYRRFTF